MKDMINHLEDTELKSLLLQVFLRIQTVEERKGYSEQQFFLDVKNTYNDLLATKNNQASSKQAQFHTTNIVFSDSAACSLEITLIKSDLIQQENIINVSDLFSIGPLWNLHTPEGINHRYNWLRTHINIDEKQLLTYEYNFEQYLLSLKQIPNDHKIIIWIGENAHEQAALRLILYVLKEKTNEIMLININEAYKMHFDLAEMESPPRHMGEISTKQLKQMYENKGNGHVVTQLERKVFEQQWLQLCQQKDVLRIWENNEIVNVPENYYDGYIIDKVKESHEKNNHKDFIKSARIIGKVMGHLNQYIGAQFIEYRVIRLIMNGVLDMEGVPTAMRHYSIKIK